MVTDRQMERLCGIVERLTDVVERLASDVARGKACETGVAEVRARLEALRSELASGVTPRAERS